MVCLSIYLRCLPGTLAANKYVVAGVKYPCQNPQPQSRLIQTICLMEPPMQPRLIVLLLSLFVVNGCARSGTSQTATNTNVLQSEHSSPAPATTAAPPSPQQETTAASSPQL